MNEQVKKELTPEVQKKLNKVLGLTKEHVFLYVPKIYRELGDELMPKSEWPIFKLKGKNGLEIADAEDNSGYMETSETEAASKLIITTGKVRIETLSRHILGWKNFKDREGELVKFTKDGDKVYKTCLMRLSADLQRELHDAINEQSVLTPEEIQGLEF